MRHPRQLPLGALLFLGLATGCHSGDNLDTQTRQNGVTCTNCSDLYLVAQPLDDLAFMNPDIQESIGHGNTVQTIYLSAGDQGLTTRGPCQPGDGLSLYQWQCRELGVKAAYAQMAGATNSWTDSVEYYAGKRMYTSRLVGHPIALTFVRLSDGGTAGAPWGTGSISGLWAETDTYVQQVGLTINPAEPYEYTKTQLINALVEALNIIDSQRVSTLDPFDIYANHHANHKAAAKFVFRARGEFGGPHRFSSYVTNDIGTLAVNLTPQQQQDKNTYLQTYLGYDRNPPSASDISRWATRMYNADSLRQMQGRIQFEDMCLSHVGEYTYGLRDCSHASSFFQLNSRRQLVYSGNLCVEAQTWSSGGALVIGLCDPYAYRQKFDILSNGTLVTAEGLCVSPINTHPKRYAYLANCDATLAGKWRPRLNAPYDAQSGTNFDNASIGSDPYKSASFQMGDINDDGLADACIRRVDGIWCAENNGTGRFDTWRQWSSGFSDALGWARPEYSKTIRLGDINGDGRADVCGRGAAGIYCALSLDTRFGRPYLASNQFGDAQGYTRIEHYRSFGLADINGDLRSDACIRDDRGLRCLFADSSGNFVREINNTDFSDARGWSFSRTGGTITYGDINGDGLDDVCGRHLYGIVCSLSAGLSFERSSTWTTSFSDTEGWLYGEHLWGTIRLADVNGDGAADVCGRGRDGISCAYSHGGTSFGPALLVMDSEYGDAQGWSTSLYAPSVQWGDLNGDQRADICGRGAGGLRCARAPSP